MPWVRRLSTVVWTIATALLIYGAYASLAILSIGRTIFGRPCGIGATRPRPLGIEVYGYFVPAWVILLLWALLPATFLGFEMFYALRRWRRDKLGLCAECGYHLTCYRGHCPGCGTRIGPGLPTRRYVLNMPRNA